LTSGERTKINKSGGKIGMRKIRLIGLVIAAALIVNLGIGCSSKQKDIKILDEKEFGKTVQSKDQVTLTFYALGQDTKDFALVRSEIEKKVKKTLNVKIDFKYQYKQEQIFLNQYIKLVISSGEPCEAFFYSDTSSMWGEPLSLQTIVKNNMAMDLSKLFPEYAPNLYSKYSKAELDSVTYNQKLVAIPSMFPRPVITSAIIRTDLMKKYGITSINSLDEYEAFLGIIKKKDPDLVPTGLGIGEKYIFAEQNGYAFIDNSTDLVYKWDDPEMKLNYYQDMPEYSTFEAMINRWKSNKYFVNSKGEDANIIFDTDKGVANVMNRNTASSIGNYPLDISQGPSFQGIRTYFIDTYENERDNYPLFPQRTSQRLAPTEQAIVIPPTAVHPGETLEFLEWIQSSQENYDLMMYGINGNQYTLYGDQIKRQTFYAYWPGSLALGNFDYFRTDVINKPSDKTKYKNLNEAKAKYPPAVGFCADYTPIMEYFGYNEDKRNLTPEQKDEIKTEIQKQLDDWREFKK
jgi:putative aldouronate transport system substrate-binding protein